MCVLQAGSGGTAARTSSYGDYRPHGHLRGTLEPRVSAAAARTTPHGGGRHGGQPHVSEVRGLPAPPSGSLTYGEVSLNGEAEC